MMRLDALKLKKGSGDDTNRVGKTKEMSKQIRCLRDTLEHNEKLE